MREDSVRTAFLWVARLEGLSLLLLLFVAVPMKYAAGWEHATMVPGWAHGLLFIAYVVLMGLVARSDSWSPARIGFGFVASLVPFGTFVFERTLEPGPAEPST